MAYEVLVSRRVEKELKKIPMADRRRVVGAMRRLSENPRPRGCAKLRGSERTYRIRSGEYRVVYDIEDEVVRVMVLRVRHRRDVYEQL